MGFARLACALRGGQTIPRVAQSGEKPSRTQVGERLNQQGRP
jgi:hypothetical protein